ncbi:hypothetical protein, partial [Planktothrix agardhii]
ADYTAARIALSLSRQRLLPLQNCWGNTGGQHPFPDALSELDCRTGIQNIVNNEDVWTWLPEWEELRQQVQNFSY